MAIGASLQNKNACEPTAVDAPWSSIRMRCMDPEIAVPVTPVVSVPPSAVRRFHLPTLDAAVDVAITQLSDADGAEL